MKRGKTQIWIRMSVIRWAFEELLTGLLIPKSFKEQPVKRFRWRPPWMKGLAVSWDPWHSTGCSGDSRAGMIPAQVALLVLSNVGRLGKFPCLCGWMF